MQPASAPVRRTFLPKDCHEEVAAIVLALTALLATACNAAVEDPTSSSAGALRAAPVGRTDTVLAAFQLHEGLTRWGEEVYVVGNLPELGEWDPRRALKLETASAPDPTSSEPSYTCVYPGWCVTRDNFLPSDTAFEYKFIKIDDAGNVTWEGGSNRVSTTPSAGSVAMMDDTWR